MLAVVKWMMIIIFSCLLLLFIGLNLPTTQRYIGKRVTSFLVKKTGKDIRVGQVGFNIWAELAIKDTYIPDNTNDTLVNFDYVAVDVHLWDLFHNKIHLEEITAEKLTFNLYKTTSDSLYNFNYLIAAFSGSSSSADTNQVDSTASGGFEFIIGNVLLEQVRGNYSDPISGLYFTGNINYLEAEADEFDLNNQLIALDEVMLKNSTWSFEQRKLSPVDTTTSEPSNWIVTVDEFFIENTKGHYINEPSGLYLYPAISYLLATEVKADIAHMDYSVEKLELKGNDIKYYAGKIVDDSKSSSSLDSSTSSINWHVSAETIQLSDNHLLYYDSTQTSLPNNQFDPAHLDVNHLTLQLNDLDISPTYVDAQLENFAFKISETMAVKTFRGQFHLDSTHLNLTEQYLETNHTKLNFSLKTTFSSLTDFLNSPEKAFINELKMSGEVGRSDIDYFYSLEELPSSIQQIAVNTELKGKLNDLTLSTFKLEVKIT